MMLLPHINNVLPLFEKVKVYEEIIIQLDILSHKIMTRPVGPHFNENTYVIVRKTMK